MSYEDDRDGTNANGRANGDTVHVKPDVMDAMERGAAPSQEEMRRPRAPRRARARRAWWRCPCLT